MTKKLLLLVLPFLLIACSNDEEPSFGLFHLTLGMEGGANVSMGDHDADITINGYRKDIRVGIVGEYDSYTISEGAPSWLSVERSDNKYFFIHVAALSGNESRSGKVGFTVHKGSKTQAGVITIYQNPLTYADLKSTERRAIREYLKKFDVVDNLPSIADIQVGSVAPFYKLDSQGTVYMQVVKMGSAPAANQGETIYFRYLRYNLLYYYENGVLPKGEGNLNSIDQSVTSFVVGSTQPATTQWGTAIQMPMLIGLPADSEVNLVVDSEAGPTAEIANVTPFLYNIRYYPAQP